MSTMTHAGNGASRPSEGQFREPLSAGGHSRQIRHDAETLAASVRDATRGAQSYLTAQVEQRPFSTLSVAAGIGYVLGGGLRSRLTVVLLGAATRVATAVIARELGARILQSGSASTQTRAPEDTSEPRRNDHED
jgi:hypothetical protein